MLLISGIWPGGMFGIPPGKVGIAGAVVLCGMAATGLSSIISLSSSFFLPEVDAGLLFSSFSFWSLSVLPSLAKTSFLNSETKVSTCSYFHQKLCTFRLALACQEQPLPFQGERVLVRIESILCRSLD
jgi:hypothetical protein